MSAGKRGRPARRPGAHLALLPGATPDVKHTSQPTTQAVWEQAIWALADRALATGRPAQMLWGTEQIVAVPDTVIREAQQRGLEIPNTWVALRDDGRKVYFFAHPGDVR